MAKCSRKFIARNINATIEIPSDYTRVEEETIFINEAKGCGMMMDYLWNIDGPIYSLADVESQREAIAANLMQNLFEVSDYQILASGKARQSICTLCEP